MRSVLTKELCLQSVDKIHLLIHSTDIIQVSWSRKANHLLESFSLMGLIMATSQSKNHSERKII